MVLDADFWALIDQARGGGARCADRAQALERLLAAIPSADIEDFASVQDELMRASYRWDLWGAAYVIKGGCSDDAFDYFRGWLLLKGREVWNAAMRDPQSLADIAVDDDAECEDILYAAGKAYEGVTGRSRPAGGGPHRGAPAGTKWEEGDLKTLYPRLWNRSVTNPGGAHAEADGVDWGEMVELGVAVLGGGRFELAAQTFATARKRASRKLTIAIATNNLAWTDLMINTPESVKEALLLANEARRMMEAEPDRDRYLGSVRGTLAFALIKNDQVGEGLALIERVLAADPAGPQQTALRLCVQAIGLAQSGDLGGARALIARVRKADPKCQLLAQARSAAGDSPVPAPEALQRLSPWLAQFGMADDAEREQAIESATTEDLTSLVEAVDKDVLEQINRYLDETDNAEDALPYGDLAQAAMEANLELRRRGVTEA